MERSRKTITWYDHHPTVKAQKSSPIYGCRLYYNNNNFSFQITIVGFKGSTFVPNEFLLRKFEHFTNRKQDYAYSGTN